MKRGRAIVILAHRIGFPRVAIMMIVAVASFSMNAAGQLQNKLRLAVIGDYGDGGVDSYLVSELVHSFNPHYVFTVGDNNYPIGSADEIDAHIGQFYFRYISPYQGSYGAGAIRNRFYPTIGNHDWLTLQAQPYLNYFQLPGNERYYEVRLNALVHMFAINTHEEEPDGVSSSSIQGQWLMSALAASNAPFKFVVGHYSPFSSSGTHGPQKAVQWPFKEWGADAVFTGHDHIYERLTIDDLPYFVNGIGGHEVYEFGETISGSQARFNYDFGAIFVEVDRRDALVRVVSKAGAVMDTYYLPESGLDYGETDLVSAHSTWRFLDNGTDQGTAWRDVGFDDSLWSLGGAELGYGDGDETTLVGFGGNPNNRFITTYFRRTFSISDPNFGELRLRVLRDDGAVIYLNGIEVARTGMPQGNVGYLTLGIPGTLPEENSFYEFILPSSGLISGENQLAVEVHQSSPSSVDMSFDLSLVGRPAYENLISQGAVWTYLDTGVTPTPDWTDLGFDDMAWSEGPAELGYGDGDEVTLLSFGEDPNNKPITNYFRHEFEATNTSAINALILRLKRDDGARVFLNGEEVYRYNLPIGNLVEGHSAVFPIGDEEETQFFETSIDPSNLVEGTNVLAVEIRQDRPDSTDVSFDLELFRM